MTRGEALNNIAGNGVPVVQFNWSFIIHQARTPENSSGLDFGTVKTACLRTDVRHQLAWRHGRLIPCPLWERTSGDRGPVSDSLRSSVYLVVVKTDHYSDFSFMDLPATSSSSSAKSLVK
jgi:hypothetical protein